MGSLIIIIVIFSLIGIIGGMFSLLTFQLQFLMGLLWLTKILKR